MAVNIELKDNYIYMYNDGGGILYDRPARETQIVKLELDSEEYCIIHNGLYERQFEKTRWDDFTLDGVPFANQQAFEDWKNANTGSKNPGDGSNDPTLGEIKDLLEGAERPIDLVEALADGSTDAGVQSVSLLFRGQNGTLDGVDVPNNFVAEYLPNKGADTVGSIDFTVPTTGQQRVLISYVRTS